MNNFGEWTEFYQFNNNNNSAFSNTQEVGFNYWFSLKNKRIEFLPELSRSFKKTENVFDNFNHAFKQYTINLNTNIYFMDLDSDCNCPTFSKEGGFVQKAIHLILSPGAGMYFHTLDEDMVRLEKEVGIYYKLGAGLGLDIGVSNLVTITPFAMLNYSSSYSTEPFRSFYDCTDPMNCLPDGFSSSSSIYSQFGIRIGFRPDYVKSNRY